MSAIPLFCGRYLTKHMNKIFLLLAGWCCLSASAQKAIDPTPDDISQAKTLREKFEDDDIVISEGKETIKFGLYKDNPEIAVFQEVKDRYLNIAPHRTDIRLYEFYNNKSKIEKFLIKWRNDRSAGFLVKDEYFAVKDLFYTDARVKYTSVDFPIQGYSYDYVMEKKYDDVKYFTSVYFSGEYPIKEKTISIIVPEWLEVELKEYNFAGYDITHEKKPDPAKKMTEHLYTLKNIPAAFDEKNAPGRSYLSPHILVVAKSFTRDGQRTALFDSTNDLYSWYKGLVNEMKDDPTVFDAKVKELTANAKTDEEKIRSIYYWVQDNIRYIAFEDGIAGFKPDDSHQVFTKRYGDCKGMANLTKQMLKAAGFDARLAWIGTKHIAYDYSLPSLAVDNHMICALMLNGKKYFLDATEKYNSFGHYAERIQNKQVMIEDGDKFILDKIPTSLTSDNKETYSVRMSIDNESLKAICSRTFAGESGTEFLCGFNSVENQKQQNALSDFLTGRDKNMSVSNLKTSDLNNRDLAIKVDYDMQLSNKVSGFDNEIYVDMDFLKEFGALEMKKRKTDYLFDYKTDYESSIVLEIPAGYKVDKLPQNLVYKGDGYSVNLSFSQTPKEISCKKSFVFQNGVIPVSEAAAWNKVVSDLNTIYKQQIVLTKS